MPSQRRLMYPTLALSYAGHTPTHEDLMQQGFTADNYSDENENLAGGYVHSTGLQIKWQNGPLGRGEERVDPNGAFVETVIAAAKQRIEYYQGVADGRFRCRENTLAITKLEEALHWLQHRTTRREDEGVEGTLEADHAR